MGLFEGMDKKASVGIAKDRLRTVLVSDRIDCNPNVCELFQKDLFLTRLRKPLMFQSPVPGSPLH